MRNPVSELCLERLLIGCSIMSIVNFSYVDKLVAIGLNKYEALAYLALLEKNNVTAIDVANRSGIPKQRIYDVLDNLRTKGVCTAREGRPRCYIARQPQQSLTAVLAYRKQQQAVENERQARFIEELIPSLNMAINGGNGESASPSHDDDQHDDDHHDDDHIDAHRDIGGL